MKQIKVLLDNFIAEKHKAEQLEVTENGTYTAPQGVAYDEVTVDVQPPLEEQEIEITEPSTVEVEATGDNYGLSKVTVNATYEKEHHDVKTLQVRKNGNYEATGDTVYNNVQVIVPQPLMTTLNVTENGTYKPLKNVAFDEVNVDVQPNLIATRVEYNENGTFELDPPAGYDGIASAEIRVNVDTEIHDVQELNVTENGTVEAEGNVVWDKVNVDVQHEFEAEPLTINSLNDLPATSSKGWLTAIKGNDLFHEEPVEITENGERYGYNVVTGQVIRKFNVNVQPALYNFETEIYNNGEYSFSAPQGYYGISNFNFNVNVEPNLVTLEQDITENGDITYNIPLDYDGYSTVTLHVDVPQQSAGFDTTQITGAASLFLRNNSTTIDVTGLDTSNFTTMSSMFQFCGNVRTLNISHYNTSKVTNMSSMFEGCKSVAVLDVSHFNTSNVTNMSKMFSDCSAITTLDVTMFDTPKVTGMDYMFRNCNKLNALDLSHFDTSNVTNMSSMFSNCSGLTSLDLSNFNTAKVTNVNSMFQSCSNLTDLDISGWDLQKVTGSTSFSNFLINCPKLANVTADNLVLPKNRALSFLSVATALTADSIVAFLNGLQPITAGYTFTIGATNLAKLSDEQKAIATSKGWKLA